MPPILLSDGSRFTVAVVAMRERSFGAIATARWRRG